MNRRTGEPAIGDAEWQAALAVLEGADAVALACHVEPDGDALGSMLALAAALRRRGTSVVASFPAADGRGESWGPPAQYRFLPGIDLLSPPAAFPPAPAVLVTLDCASPERLGSLQPAAAAAGTVLVIDHHVRGEAFGDVRLLDGDAAATAVLVAGLIDRLGVAFDRDIATNLYVGLVTDTGRFQYSSTTPEVLHLAARLVSHDIGHAEIGRRIWDTHSFGYLKVLGRALERTRVEPAASLAWTAVRQADLAELGVGLEETEGIIDALRAVEQVECALICKEQPGGGWKASLRSKGAVDVGAVAARLGGGGHAFAAGFSSAEPLGEIVAAVVGLLAGDAADPVAAGTG